jgi:ribosome-binding protein aMBF1 (putative translation factor)
MTTMDQCEICSARVQELRRGRCWGCYNRWVESRPVGLGASCRMCGERRRDYLRSVELLGSWSPVCHSCAGRMTALDDLPQSLAGIRALLGRERRSAARRTGRADGRVFPYERRDRDRRAGAEDRRAVDDRVDEEMIVEIAELAHDLEALAAELPGERGADLTRIHETG